MGIKTLKVLASAVIYIFVFIGFMPTNASATKIFTAAHSCPEGVPREATWKLFGKLVDAYTNGDIKIKISGGGKLCVETRCVEQLQQGGIDMMDITVSNLGGFTSNLYVINLPYMFENQEHAKRVLTGPVGRHLKQTLKKYGYKALHIIPCGGFRQLVNNEKEIRVPNDLKGMKMRTTASPIEKSLIEAWGGVPMMVPWAETYQALQTKIVSGLYLHTLYANIAKIYETSKFLTIVDGIYALQIGLMRQKDFEKLTLSQKLLIEQASDEAQDAAYALSAAYESKVGEEIKRQGVKVYRPTPAEKKLWQQKGQTIWSKFSDKTDPEIVKAIGALKKSRNDLDNVKQLFEIADMKYQK